MPPVLKRKPRPEVEKSKALSLFARPGDGSIRTRRVAILVADGVDGEAAATLHEGLVRAGAVPRFVGARLGEVQTQQEEALEVEVTLETGPSVLYDAVAVPGGHEAVEKLANLGHALEFVKDAYRHCKPILAIGAGSALLDAAGASESLMSGESDPGVLTFDEDEADAALRELIAAIAKHRHFTREVDPPLV
jgi:catalase